MCGCAGVVVALCGVGIVFCVCCVLLICCCIAAMSVVWVLCFACSVVSCGRFVFGVSCRFCYVVVCLH